MTDSPTPPSALKGAALIADQVKRLPEKPGVYRMVGDGGDILYVGKARNLKRRVANYAKGTGHSNRIMRMIAETRSMEFVVTETETESLLLEANLIKQLKPKFNVLLRDDKSFPYILIATDHTAPQIVKHRGAQKRKGHYFGPFASAGAVNRTINTLQKAFLLRTCTDSVYEGRTRPCLLHQIKRCAAPCVDLVDREGYDALVRDAVDFLNGKNRQIQGELSAEMERASEDLDFERAASLRDRIRALTYVQESQDINPGTVTNADVFALHHEGGQACIQTFFFRAGQNWGNHNFFPRHDREDTSAEILQAFLAQFYDGREAPRLILISEEIEEAPLLMEALAIKAGHKIEILAPQRGEKRDLVNHALMNAREALGRRLSESASQKKLMAQLCETLGMDQPPARIEVYDNSHISGTNALGGMIVAGEEGFRKNAYRKFNIKSDEITPGDDFGMMREVLTRRFSRLVKEETPGSDNWPGLVVIDGGAGQLSAARAVMEDAGLAIGPQTEQGEIMLVSIAKGRREDERGRKRTDRTASATGEQFFIPGKPPFTLEARSPVLYYLQRLRDEAHRFAIGSHRARRKRQMTTNPLDSIEGVGGKRKKALLHHFGSAKAVARAKAEDLAAVEGISEAMATRIYDHFHGAK
ncbi:excinuclease ABC subunit UvrC [Aquisalinus flavus]|uniref:UvrABC system protein C n=1 Tax=Aquisalinus flavus TaxID=1526572 RepID=A0A8J2V2R5_9PROT|nr:excinuclease ABC subunit UvrC [Aquisalinus flavus]MBD0426607.1 excinuclease ABC subunit UvrC [Aquisalinus flavus]UNE47848.1 excinuclease ABC subunit UvrC [Aquisalinus flavus]GGD06546.1 UvrABC system protein C [Aquisalinus flavus]